VTATQPGPLSRISALAEDIGVIVFDVPPEATDGLAGAVAVAGIDPDGVLRASIGLAEDLNEQLRSDVLAFGIAVFVGEPGRLLSQANGMLGIGRARLKCAQRGAGYLERVSRGRDQMSAMILCRGR
jgi:hypothetical protein